VKHSEEQLFLDIVRRNPRGKDESFVEGCERLENLFGFQREVAQREPEPVGE